MIRHPLLPAAFATVLLAAVPVLAADADARQHMSMDLGGRVQSGLRLDATLHNPDDLAWGDAPPVLPRGAQAVVLDGDPHKPGPYVLRLKMPAGYQIPAHWHSKPENVTVIAGTLYLGMGDKLDEKSAQVLKTGGFHAIPAEVHHFAFSRGGAIVQIHGEGPFDITYINPADNPDPAAKKKADAP